MLRACLILFASVCLGSCESACPTIDCTPQVQLTYQNPVSAPYHLTTTFHGNTFEADCPLQASLAKIVGIKSCSSTEVLVTGVDLGKGQNDALEVDVTIDAMPKVMVTATLERILNSRSCDLVCFSHTGVVRN